MDAYEKNILSFPEQLSARNLRVRNLKKLSRSKPDGIIVCGMGGSGLAGELLKAAAKELKLKTPVLIWKNYGLPEHNFRKPLYVFVSFSGNTEETLSGLKLARGNKAVVAAGGKMLAQALHKDIPLAAFAAGVLTPRQSVGIMFYAVCELLTAARLMPRVRPFHKIDPLAYRDNGKKLAKKLARKLITIYTDEAHRHLGYIWKIKCNETAKAHAFNDVLPEMDHNELTAFDTPPRLPKIPTAAIFLLDPHEPARLRKKFRITRRIISEHHNLALELPLKGGSEIEKAWQTLLLADWTTYFLGKLHGIPAKEFNIVNPKIVIALKRLMG